MDFVQPIMRKPLFGFERSVLNLALRLEYTDWNVGQFTETNSNIADDQWWIVPGISFRPTPQTVIRANYRYGRTQDILGNPPVATGGVQIGISSYF